jgi:hypothetical protein
MFCRPFVLSVLTAFALSFLVLPLTTAVVGSWVRLAQGLPLLHLMVEIGFGFRLKQVMWAPVNVW